MRFRDLQTLDQLKVKYLHIKTRVAKLKIERRNVQDELALLKAEIKQFNIQISDLRQPSYITHTPLTSEVLELIIVLTAKRDEIANEYESLKYRLTQVANDADQCEIDKLALDEQKIKIKAFKNQQHKLHQAVNA